MYRCIGMSKYWDSVEDYDIEQSNNALEKISDKAFNEESNLFEPHLRWCGPSLAALMFSIMKSYKVIRSYDPKTQPEDRIGLWFHNPENIPLMKEIDPAFDYQKDYPNYYMKFYPLMSQSLYNIEGDFLDRVLSEYEIRDHLDGGGTIQLCLNDPGHYVGLGHYQGHLYYEYDPWRNRTGKRRYVVTYKDIVEEHLPAAILYYAEGQ